MDTATSTKWQERISHNRSGMLHTISINKPHVKNDSLLKTSQTHFLLKTIYTHPQRIWCDDNPIRSGEWTLGLSIIIVEL